MRPLRPYQQKAIAQTFEAMRKHDRVMLQAPTGSGKTRVAEAIIEMGLKHGRRVGFIVDRLTLLDQTLEQFTRSGFHVGVVQSGHPLANPAAPVQIISAQTLARRRPLQWPHIDLAIIDEAHTNYSIYETMMTHWDGIKYLGLSATPFTRGLGLVWQALVRCSSTAELIEQGYLANYTAFGPSTPDLKGVRMSGGDYSKEDVAQRMTVLTGGIIEHYLKHVPGKQAIAFTPTVAYAMELAEAFNKAGVPADYVHGGDEDERRLDSLKRFRSGETRVMCNCEVLTKGFDLPQVEVGIIARPTRSLSLHIQMLGRVLRTSPGKDHAVILDHAGNIERLGLPDDDLPDELCTAAKGEKSDKDSRKKDEPLPWNCPKCHALVEPGKGRCECGFVPERKRESNVEVLPGVLQRITGRTEKASLYAQLNCIAKDKGYKEGWVAHKYREITGVWPRGVNKAHIEVPSQDLRNWLLSKQIAYAKRKTA